MSEQLQLRRGTSSQVAANTPVAGEPWVDTTNNRICIGDGSTAGGWPAAKLSEVGAGSNLATAAVAANGASIQLGVIETLASSLSGATVTISSIVPANCIVFAVGARVTTTITGATSYSVGWNGPGGTTSTFGSGLSLPAGSTNNGLIGPVANYTAANLTLTAAGSNFTGGAVRLSIHYMLCAPSAS